MKVIDLSGRQHNWNLTGHIAEPSDLRPRSELHVRCRELLKRLFLNEPILEELCIPGEQLYIDFFVARRKLIIEVNGEQHYKYIKHFHGNIAGFKNYKKNEERKKEWAKINNFRFVELSYMEDINEWERSIRQV
jgi:hypothetical protein